MFLLQDALMLPLSFCRLQKAQFIALIRTEQHAKISVNAVKKIVATATKKEKNVRKILKANQKNAVLV